MTKIYLATLVCFVITAAGPRGAVSEPGRIPRINHNVVVDGRLEDPAWSNAWSTLLPYEVHPGDNSPAPVRTEVLLMHDESFLYVGFRAWDPEPSSIRARLSDRDDAWSDDWVGVVLDTFNDERRDYLLVVNPLGVQMDNIEVWPGGATEWDGIWDSSARVNEWGWTAEIRIPFSTLRFQRSESSQVWGFDAIRGYQRDRFRQMGAFVRDRNNNCYLCQAIKIEGFEGVSPGHNLDLFPTVTTSRTERREDIPNGDYGEPEDELEAGFTARWGFTPNLTVAATLNPDFSQVEADARQLEVNQPFELFFPEKRPFFMEGADFFGTLLNVVYTRMIRDPLWGGKITGKEGAHTVGAYVLEDEISNLIFPGPYRSGATTLENNTTAVVARYKLDVGNRLTAGLLGTNREGGDYRNGVAGVDLDVRLSERDRIEVQALGSTTRYPEEIVTAFGQPSGGFDDGAAILFYTREARTLSLWAQAVDYGEHFRADLGYMPRVDVRGGEVGFSYNWIGTDQTFYSNINLKGKLEYRETHGGDLLFEEDALQLTLSGPLQSTAIVRLGRGREGFLGETYDANTIVLSGSLKPDRHGECWLTFRAGDRVDYANAREGSRVQLNPGLSYQLGRHLRVEANHFFERMEDGGVRLYTANVFDATVAWQFNARSFVRAIVQFVDYDFNIDLYTDGRDRRFQHVFNQFLYSYKINPQTVLFLGYSDNSYGAYNYDIVRADRTVFAKIGYAWVL